MDVTINYLNEERVKLWMEIDAIKKALEEAVAKLSQTDKATISSIQTQGQNLETKIAAVKQIADEKTPEDVQTASRAAQEVVKIKTAVQAVQREAEEYRSRLNAAKNALNRINGIADNSDAANKAIEESRAKVLAAVKSIDSFIAQFSEKKTLIDDMISKISAAASSSTDKAQDIANLKAQAGNAASEVSASRQKLQELQASFEELQEKQASVFNESKEKFDSLKEENQSRFDKLYLGSEKRIKELEEQINTLLPGATSLSLSSSFGMRKEAVEQNKWWWAMLLVMSAGAIVCFGLWSLARITANQSLSALPNRIIIVAGLVIIEEFARRNYNVCSRLAEAYAYKEAIAKSYVGFKNELAEIDLPSRTEGEIIKSISVLAETFLQKLGDEPGKKVFDKERPALGVVQAISKMSGQEELVSDKTQVVATATRFLSKISWPLVVLVSVLAIAGCVVVWLLSNN